jgi:hypothetical protein
VSPVKYELGFYIPKDDIPHSYCRETLISYNAILVCCFVSKPEAAREILAMSAHVSVSSVHVREHVSFNGHRNQEFISHPFQ